MHSPALAAVSIAVCVSDRELEIDAKSRPRRATEQRENTVAQ
jgi:hypothetical protein